MAEKLPYLIPGESASGEDAEDTELLRKMSHKAADYISSQKWATKIERTYFGYGVGGLVGVFLVCFEKPVGSNDKCLWVIVGDVPSAYLVVDE